MGGILAWHLLLAAVIVLLLVVIGGTIYIVKRGVPRTVTRRVAGRGKARPTR